MQKQAFNEMQPHKGGDDVGNRAAFLCQGAFFSPQAVKNDNGDRVTLIEMGFN